MCFTLARGIISVYHLLQLLFSRCLRRAVAMRDHPHNFQHWMSWLGRWWRVQQNVISMLKSRIPWIHRDLNVNCALRLFLKVCLFQCMCAYASELNAAVACTAIVVACDVSLCVRAGCGPWHIQCIVSCVSHAGRCHGVHGPLQMCGIITTWVNRWHTNLLTESWTQASKPAEFKHISRRWMRNPQGFLQ